jgi:hypothetical protein
MDRQSDSPLMQAIARRWIVKYSKIAVVGAAAVGLILFFATRRSVPLGEVLELAGPYHAAYSENALVIAQGHLREALEAAYDLKARMASDETLWNDKATPKAGRAVYAYNLLRIAALEREMGARAREVAVLNEVLSNAGWDNAQNKTHTYDPATYAAIAEQLQRGDVTLADYIKNSL